MYSSCWATSSLQSVLECLANSFHRCMCTYLHPICNISSYSMVCTKASLSLTKMTRALFSAIDQPRNSSAPTSGNLARTPAQSKRQKLSFLSELLRNKQITQNLKMVIKVRCRSSRSFWCKQMNLDRKIVFTSSVSHSGELHSQTHKLRNKVRSISKSASRALSSLGKKLSQSTFMTSLTILSH